MPNNSRASFAVVTASRTLWQPAVFGKTLTPSSRISDQKASPVLPPAVSRRTETVTSSAPEARIACCMIGGRGIERRADQQARAELFAIECNHRVSLPAAA